MEDLANVRDAVSERKLSPKREEQLTSESCTTFCPYKENLRVNSIFNMCIFLRNFFISKSITAQKTTNEPHIYTYYLLKLSNFSQFIHGICNTKFFCSVYKVLRNLNEL